MNYSELKKILKDIYKTDSVKSIMCGRARPSYIKMVELSKQGIPFEAWLDIKSFIAANSTTPKECEQELQGDKECA